MLETAGSLNRLSLRESFFKYILAYSEPFTVCSFILSMISSSKEPCQTIFSSFLIFFTLSLATVNRHYLLIWFSNYCRIPYVIETLLSMGIPTQGRTLRMNWLFIGLTSRHQYYWHQYWLCIQGIHFGLSCNLSNIGHTKYDYFNANLPTIQSRCIPEHIHAYGTF